MAAISETAQCFKPAMRGRSRPITSLARTLFVVAATTFTSPSIAQNLSDGIAVQSPTPPLTSKLPLLRVPPPRDVPWTELLDPERELNGSLSLGMTSNGSLERASQLELDGEAHHVLDPHRDRDTHWATDELVDLLLEASRLARSRWPEMRVGVGNMSRREGGRIQWSRSHRCGRDVDLAFRYLDETGAPVDSPDLLVVDRRLRVRGRDGWTLDVPRTWTMVASLIEAAPSHIQWLFVSRPIRTALLEHAAEIGAPAHIVEIASNVLHQPGDSAPHDDHLHVRIYCAEDDLIEGCDNWGPRWPHRPDYTDAAVMRLRTLLNAWEQGGPDARRNVESRLAVLYLGDGAVGLTAELHAADDDLLATVIPWLGTHHPASAGRAVADVLLHRHPSSPAWAAAADYATQSRSDTLARVVTHRLRGTLTPVTGEPDPELANALLNIVHELAPPAVVPPLWQLSRSLPPSEFTEAISAVLNRATAGAAIDRMDETQIETLMISITQDHLLYNVARLSDAGFTVDPSRRSTWRDLLDGLEDRRDWVRFTTREVLAALTGRPRPAPDSTTEESVRYWRRILTR